MSFKTCALCFQPYHTVVTGGLVFAAYQRLVIRRVALIPHTLYCIVAATQAHDSLFSCILSTHRHNFYMSSTTNECKWSIFIRRWITPHCWMHVRLCVYAEGGLSRSCDGIHQVLHIDHGAIMSFPAEKNDARRNAPNGALHSERVFHPTACRQRCSDTFFSSCFSCVKW